MPLAARTEDPTRDKGLGASMTDAPGRPRSDQVQAAYSFEFLLHTEGSNTDFTVRGISLA